MSLWAPAIQQISGDINKRQARKDAWLKDSTAEGSSQAKEQGKTHKHKSQETHGSGSITRKTSEGYVRQRKGAQQRGPCLSNNNGLTVETDVGGGRGAGAPTCNGGVLQCHAGRRGDRRGAGLCGGHVVIGNLKQMGCSERSSAAIQRPLRATSRKQKQGAVLCHLPVYELRVETHKHLWGDEGFHDKGIQGGEGTEDLHCSDPADTQSCRCRCLLCCRLRQHCCRFLLPMARLQPGPPAGGIKNSQGCATNPLPLEALFSARKHLLPKTPPNTPLEPMPSPCISQPTGGASIRTAGPHRHRCPAR